MKSRVCRAFDFEMRATQNEEHGNFVEGHPIVYDQSTAIGDWFYEIIDRGALDDADLKDVKFLVNHDTSMIPLARSRNNNANSTMQMSVADDGMHVRVDLDTENNSDAANLYSAIKRGDVSGMSFMFTVDGEEWEDLESDMPTRHITKIDRVFEVSAVTFPAYEQTSISARDDIEALESARELLESRKAEEAKRAESEKRAEDIEKLMQRLNELEAR